MGTVSERTSWPMRYWILLWAGYFSVSVFLGDWNEAQLVGFVRWLVAIGGYGLSNAVLGGHLGLAHAGVMDAYRGLPPAPAPR